MGGDFNMTENMEDCSVDYVGKAMTRREEAIWNMLMIKLGVNDVYRLDEFRAIKNKSYT